MQPLVTVIVPIYNCEKYVERAAVSVLNQPCADRIELVLVDDGSKDGSGSIIDRIAEKYGNVRVFHKENGGEASARNLGIENAHGKYLAFVDADDWWEPDFFDDKLCRELNRPDEIDLYCFVLRAVSYDMKYGGMSSLKEAEKRYSEPCLKDKDFVSQSHPSWFYRRAFITDNGLRYLNTKVHGDVPFVEMSLFLALSVKSINRLMYNYYMNLESCMHTSNCVLKLNETIKSLQIKKRLYSEKGLGYESLIDRETVSMAAELLPRLCSENSYRAVVDCLNSEKHGVLRDGSVQPWDYLIKRWNRWKKHPKIFWMMSRLHPGIVLSLKRALYRMPWSRSLTDHIFCRFIKKWQRIDIKLPASCT